VEEEMHGRQLQFLAAFWCAQQGLGDVLVEEQEGAMAAVRNLGARGCAATPRLMVGRRSRGTQEITATARAAGRQGQRRRHLFVDAQEEGEDARGLGPAAATGAPGGERGNREKGG
jgi:hypothetical protein